MPWLLKMGLLLMGIVLLLAGDSFTSASAVPRDTISDEDATNGLISKVQLKVQAIAPTKAADEDGQVFTALASGGARALLAKKNKKKKPPSPPFVFPNFPKQPPQPPRPPPPPPAVEGDVDLRYGSFDSESSKGAVVMFYQGRWGLVCRDRWYDDTAANLVCRQLGYSYGINQIVFSNPPSNLPVVVSQVSCSELDTKLFNCVSLKTASAAQSLNCSRPAEAACYNAPPSPPVRPAPPLDPAFTQGLTLGSIGKTVLQSSLFVATQGSGVSAQPSFCTDGLTGDKTKVCQTAESARRSWISVDLGQSQLVGTVILYAGYCCGFPKRPLTVLAGDVPPDQLVLEPFPEYTFEPNTLNYIKGNYLDGKALGGTYGSKNAVYCFGQGTPGEEVGPKAYLCGNVHARYITISQFTDTATPVGLSEIQIYILPYSPQPGPAPYSLRLAGGTSTEGRLEIFYQGVWGTICLAANAIGQSSDATGACKQLGYASGAFLPRGSYAPGSGPIWLANALDCLGQAASGAAYQSCQDKKLFGLHQCTHAQDVAITCSNTQLASPPPPSPPPPPAVTFQYTKVRIGKPQGNTWVDSNSGYVGLQLGPAKFTGICQDDASSNNIYVACKEAGFYTADYRKSSKVKPGKPIVKPTVRFNCTAEETGLKNCPVTSPVPKPSKTCKKPLKVVCIKPSAGSFRNVDGPTNQKGRLERFTNGSWSQAVDLSNAASSPFIATILPIVCGYSSFDAAYTPRLYTQPFGLVTSSSWVEVGDGPCTAKSPAGCFKVTAGGTRNIGVGVDCTLIIPGNPPFPARAPPPPPPAPPPPPLL